MAGRRDDPGLPQARVPVVVRSALDSVITGAIEGFGPLKGGVEVAEEHLRDAPDNEEAIRRLVRTHVRLAGASGFVTGLGGIAALPVTLPAGVSGLYIIAARMAIGIAHLRGYDVRSEEVRSAIVVCLIGSAGAEAAKRVGRRTAQRFLTTSLRRMGLRALTKAGATGVANLGKAIPLVGGPVGGAADMAACRAIAGYAGRVFVVRPGRGTTITVG
ncbi:MAG: EcsC family protein [Actinomycetes bacterium]